MTDRTEVVRLYLVQGLTCAEIGRKIGITRERVRQILVAEGVVPRPRSETVVCAWCQRSFRVGLSAHAKFCSRECSAKGRRQDVCLRGHDTRAPDSRSNGHCKKCLYLRTPIYLRAYVARRIAAGMCATAGCGRKRVSTRLCKYHLALGRASTDRYRARKGAA